MQKIIRIIALLALSWPVFSQSALERLAAGAAEEILALLKAPNPVAATLEYRNYSFLSDLQAQTFYQLLSVKLEQSGKLRYRDLMVDLVDGKGQFNYSDLSRIRYGLHLVLLNHPRGIAFAASVRTAERSELLGLVFRSAAIDPAELWSVSLLGDGPASGRLVMNRTETFRVDHSIFHVAQDVEGTDGRNDLYALTPEHLIVWRGGGPSQGPGEKIPLSWSSPRTPSIRNEGKIVFLKAQGERFLALGANFSPGGLVFRGISQGLSAAQTVSFVPFAAAVVGDEPCWIGCRYLPGTNLFDGVIQFAPTAPWDAQKKEGAPAARRKMDPFLDMAFLKREDGRIASVFSVDEAYRLGMHDAEWNPLVGLGGEAPSCGASMALVQGRWLVTSAAQRKNDALSLYFIADGGLRHVGRQELEGMIHSMREGIFNGEPGVWVLRQTSDPFAQKTNWLDFWRVAKDEE